MRKLSLAVIFLSLIQVGSAQAPKQLYSFFSDGGRWCSNFLSLYDNGAFYYYGPCENDVAIGKGTWTLKDNILFLKGQDSSSSYPRPTIQLIKGNTDSLLFTVRDIHNRPFPYFGVTLFNQKGQGSEHFTDTTGMFKVEKNYYTRFALTFQISSEQASELKKLDTFANEVIVTEAKEVRITLDTPAFKCLNRGLTLVNFGNYAYILREESLRDIKGNIIYQIERKRR